MTKALPSWVIEQSLNFALFNCCGVEDLFPFGCPDCGHVYVLCTECDALYTDLADLSQRGRWEWNNDHCGECSTEFDNNFMRTPRCRVSYADWHDAGLEGLLVDCPISRLQEILTASGEIIAEYLRRGMRSTAKTRLTGFQNLAESIQVHVVDAESARSAGTRCAEKHTLAEAMDWYDGLPAAPSRTYSLLGIADQVFS